MRILVIGGTIFVGRHFVEAALKQGHDVTLFHRGQRGADLFPAAERVLGDRETDLDKLEGDWDAVVDTCGYLPRVVRLSAQHFVGRCQRYVFVSTISVFSDMSAPPDEESQVGVLEDPSVEAITGETYGGLKALCETEVTAAFGGQALIIRPGLIIGPHDPTDRFTYWPVMLSSAKSVIVPERSQPAQWIDVRDLTHWMLQMVEEQASGTFNAVGPDMPVTVQEAIWAVREAVGGRATIEIVGSERLVAANVTPWSDLPMVVDFDGSVDNMCRVLNQKAMDAGLRFRPIGESAKDTLAWRSTVETPLKVGLTEERIEALIGN